MTIASRTPEGFPSKCPLCGAETELEFSDPGADAPCPCCGFLLLQSAAMLERLRHALAAMLGIDPEKITAETQLSEFWAPDSLDAADLFLEFFGEEFPAGIRPDQLAQADTVADFARLIAEEMRENDGAP